MRMTRAGRSGEGMQLCLWSRESLERVVALERAGVPEPCSPRLQGQRRLLQVLRSPREPVQGSCLDLTLLKDFLPWCPRVVSPAALRQAAGQAAWP